MKKSPTANDEPARLGLLVSEWRLIGIIAVIKAILFFYVTRSFQVLENQPLSGFWGWLAIWNRWDALNYHKLAEFGYGATETKTLLGFYPLYPWLVHFLTFGSGKYLISAFVISTVASFGAGILFRRLLLLDYEET